MTALLFPDEAARLRPGEQLVIVRAGEPCLLQHPLECNGRHADLFPPSAWVALTGPCPTCKDSGWPGYVLADVSEMSGTALNDCGAGAPFKRCRDCRDSHSIVPLFTKPTCRQPAERGDGTLCGSDYEVALVDVARYEGDGESTFFHLPICYGHRLALGEHVVAYEPCGRVLVGRGSIEVVPVVDHQAPSCIWVAKRSAYLCDTTGGAVKRLDSWPHLNLPRPGVDFGVVIDCVEVAS